MNSSIFDKLPRYLGRRIFKIFKIFFVETKLKNLPENAIRYIKTLEELMETKISVVSTGPDRKETIDINGTLLNI